MSKKREWFKWKLRSGRRGTLRRAAIRSGNGFEVMGACVAMLDHARGESHWTENPEGVFKTSILDLSIDYGTPESRVRESLGALVATGWLNASGDVAVVGAEDEIHFRIVRYLAFNHPQGSSTDRKAAERDSEVVAAKALLFRGLLAEDVDPAQMAEVLDLRGSVTTSASGAEIAQKCTEGEGEGELTNMSSSVKPTSDDLARKLFELWLTETGRNPNQNRLTTKRRGLVRARLKDGYTEEQLRQAIQGIAASPWHQGQNPSGQRYDTFQFIFRDGENIEKGIERIAGASATGSTDAFVASLGYGETA